MNALDLVPNSHLLTGRAAHRWLDGHDDGGATPSTALLESPPAWLLNAIRWADYTAAMSMSTVSVELNNPHFIPHVIWNILRQFRHVEFADYGCILDVSSATHTTNEEDLNPASKVHKERKGRKPINEKVAPKRSHGQFRAFGRSVEVHLRIKLDEPFKDQYERMYRIKFFSTNMQVPGCCSENHSDVKKITRFMTALLERGYATIPPPPSGFEVIQKALTDAGEERLRYATSADYDDIVVGTIRVYSRNYTFHYNPLVGEKAPNGIEQARVIHLGELDSYIRNEAGLVRSWVEGCGLLTVVGEYTGISETANRRLQYVFNTPQLIRPGSADLSKKSQVTKAFLEGSGKLNIEMTNNYYWHDTLWRILCFMDKMFTLPFIKPRMSTALSRRQAGNIEALYFSRAIGESEILMYLVGINSESDGE